VGFVTLHSHSEGSLLDGIGSPIQRAEQAKEMGAKALALTDHGNLILAPNHVKACNEVGIKPILGVEAYFMPDRFTKTHKGKTNHLILLAKNQQGWKNLMKMTTEAHLTGVYKKACVDWSLLKEYSEGIICSSACISGHLPKLLLEGEDHEIHECVERHLAIFGEDYYFEIMPHDLPAQQTVNARLSNLAVEYGIKMIATDDSHYPYEDWLDTKAVAYWIATRTTKAKHEAKVEAGEDVYDQSLPLHMVSSLEMQERLARGHSYLTSQTIKDAVEQTGIIADQIEEITFDSSIKMPKVASSTEKAHEMLKKWSKEGLVRVGREDDKEYEERLRHELQTIKDLGVSQYFVLVGKIVRWAREQGIRISSGRGSASGSLVCYLSNITTIDPIAHDLLFERFLNPNRKGLPDIDIDFEDRRRDEVLQYIKDEFGKEHMAPILTLGTFGAKAAIKDVSRVFDVPFQESNLVTKAIPEAKDVGGAGNIPPLSQCREMFTVIDEYAEKYPEVWKHATRLEGHIKQLGKHAGGVIITDQPVVEHVPLMRGANDIVTAWSDTARYAVITELLGLLKVDILSLEGLSKQGETIELIRQNHDIDINLDDLPVARDPEAIEPEVMQVFSRGETLGVFQFGGSKGITSFLKQVKPDSFEDLIAVNALYRPGGLEGGDAYKYGELKNGKAPVSYWHESVAPYLKKTYGIMAYQEQMQQIAQALGDFTPGQSDDMRKATSTLYRLGKAEAKEFMAQYKEQWMKGCANHGLNEYEAERIWDRMLAFGGYSFNRSHSASYSLAAYQDAWLKTHYSAEFYAPLLSHEKDLQYIINEAKGRDIEVTPPDVNESRAEFSVVGNTLRYGLLSIKYVGDAAVADIIANRPYKDLEDFKEKTTKAKCDRRVQEYLIKAGAFDFCGERSHMTIEQKRIAEADAMGISISGVGESERFSDIIESRILPEDEYEKLQEGDGMIAAGEITDMKHHTIKSGTNKGKKMGFATLSYKQQSWNITIFKAKYDKYKSMLVQGNVVLVRGRVGGQGEVIADSIIEATKLDELLKEGN
jgi:DNA polymerase-3 subunit alpha